MKISAAVLAAALGIGSGAASAQMAPYDLVPPYRINMLVRANGLMPVAPPIRYGASYIVRAIDRYGNPVRVVIDGRRGEIVVAHRITDPYGRPIMARPFAPYADPYGDADPTGVDRAYAPVPPRPSTAIPGPREADTPLIGLAAPNRLAHPPARPPLPRARPASAPPAALAAVKPERQDASPGAAPVPDVAAKKPERKDAAPGEPVAALPASVESTPAVKPAGEAARPDAAAAKAAPEIAAAKPSPAPAPVAAPDAAPPSPPNQAFPPVQLPE